MKTGTVYTSTYTNQRTNLSCQSWVTVLDTTDHAIRYELKTLWSDGLPESNIVRWIPKTTFRARVKDMEVTR